MAKKKAKKLHKRKTKKSWLTKWKLAILGFFVVTIALLIPILKEHQNVLGLAKTSSSCTAAGGICAASGFCKDPSANGYKSVGVKNCDYKKRQVCCVPVATPTPVIKGRIQVDIISQNNSFSYPPIGSDVEIYLNNSARNNVPVGKIYPINQGWAGQLPIGTVAVVAHPTRSYRVSFSSCYNCHTPAEATALGSTTFKKGPAIFPVIEATKDLNVFVKFQPN